MAQHPRYQPIPREIMNLPEPTRILSGILPSHALTCACKGPTADGAQAHTPQQIPLNLQPPPPPQVSQ